MDANESAEKASGQGAGPAGDASPRVVRISSRTLFQGAQEVLIEHEGQVYRLRLTRANKMILQK